MKKKLLPTAMIMIRPTHVANSATYLVIDVVQDEVHCHPAALQKIRSVLGLLSPLPSGGQLMAIGHSIARPLITQTLLLPVLIFALLTITITNRLPICAFAAIPSLILILNAIQ